MLVSRDIEGNRPKTGRCSSTGNEDGVVLDDLDIILGEKCDAIIVAELGKRDKSTSLEVIENKSRLRFDAETRREGEDATESGRHDSTAGGKNLWAMRNWSWMSEIDGIRTGDKSAGGTGV